MEVGRIPEVDGEGLFVTDRLGLLDRDHRSVVDPPGQLRQVGPTATPRYLWRASAGMAANSPMVVTPRARRRRSVTGPMPHRARTGIGCRNASSASGGTSTTPGPGSMPDREARGLAALDASLAISFDRPTPTEHARAISSRTRARMS